MKKTFSCVVVVNFLVFGGCARQTPTKKTLTKSEKMAKFAELIVDRGGRGSGGNTGFGGDGPIRFGRESRPEKTYPPEPPEQPIDVETAKYFRYGGNTDVSKLIKFFGHANPAVRKGALRKLGWSDPPPKAAFSKAIPLLKDKSSNVRAAAAEFIGKYGNDAAPAIKDLIGLLKHHKYDVASNAGATLSKMSKLLDPHIQELIEIVKDTETPHEEYAISVLGDIGPKAKAAIPVLAPRVMRWGGQASAEAIGKMGGANTLLAAVNNTDENVRSNAVSGLGFLPKVTPNAVAALIQAADDTEQRVRRSAATSLGAIRPTTEPVVTALSKLLNDKNSNVQATAAQALGNIEPKLDSAVVPLLAATKSKDVWLRSRATESLAKFKTSLRPRILAALELFHTDPYTAKTIFDKNPKKAAPILLKLVRDTQQPLQLRMNAILAVNGYKVREADESTIKALNKKLIEDSKESLEIRAIAAYVIRDHFEEHPLDQKTFLEALENSKNSYVLEQVLSKLYSIARSKDPKMVSRAVASLMSLLKSGDKNQVKLACSAISNFEANASSAIPVLCRIVSDRTSENRSYAARALGAIDLEGKAAVPVLLAAIDKNFGIGEAFGPIGTIIDRVRKKNGDNPKYEFDTQAVIALAVNELRKKDSYERDDSANLLAHFGPHAASSVPALIPLLDDESEYVRRAGIDALGAIGPKSKDAIPKLLTMVKDPAGKNYEAAFGALCSIRPPIDEFLPTLLNGLKKEDTHTDAVRGLAGYGEQAEKALPTITKMFASDDKRQRKSAMKIAAAMGPKAITLLPDLRKSISSDDSETKKLALTAIGRLGSKGTAALPDVKAALGNASRWNGTRKIAADTLIRISGDQPEHLMPLLQHMDPNRKDDDYAKAIVGLGKKALPVLKMSLTSENRTIRDNGMKLLQSSVASANYEAMLLSLLDEKDAKLQLQAAIRISQRGGHSKRITPILMKGLVSNNDKENRWELDRAIRDLGRPAVPRLLAIFQNDQQKLPVRQRAADLLRNQYSNLESSIPTLQTLLADKNAFTRSQAALILVNAAPETPNLHKVLLAELQSQDEKARAAAVNALGSSRFKKHFDTIRPALLAALNDKDQRVRRNASYALTQMIRDEDVPALKKLYDSNKDLRVVVLHALDRYEKPSVKGLPLFVAAISSDDEDLRNSVSPSTLTRFGRPGIDAILKLAADTKIPTESRKAVLNAFSKNQKLTDADHKILLSLLKEKENAIQISAASALAKQGVANPQILTLLVKGIQDKDYSTQDSSQEALRSLGKKAAPILPQVKSLLKSEEDNIRRACYAIYATIGKEESGTVDVLVARLKTEDDSSARRRLIDQLGMLDSKAVPALSAALKSTDEQTVLGALNSLQEMRPKSAAKATDAVTGLLNHSESEIRLQAAILLAGFEKKPSERIVPILMKGLNAYDDSTKYAALSALEKSGPAAAIAVPKALELAEQQTYASSVMRFMKAVGPGAKSAIPWLMRELQNSRNVYYASNALAAIGKDAESTVPELLVMLKNERLMGSAAKVLVKLAPKRAVNGLIRLLDDEYLKYHAINHLALFGKDSTPAISKLESLLGSTDPAMRQLAVLSLGHLQEVSRSSVPTLLKLLKTTPKRHRDEIIWALGQIKSNHEQVVPVLMRVAESEPVLRSAAVRALSRFGADAAPAVTMLTSYLDDKQTRYSAIRALGAIGPAAKPAVGKIAVLLSAKEEYQRQTAAKALGDIGPNAVEAVPKLIPLLKSKSEYIRDTVAEALWKIDPAAAQKAGAPKPKPENPKS